MGRGKPFAGVAHFRVEGSPMVVEPLTFMFSDDGSVPNNAALPLIVYRGGVDVTAACDPETAIEHIPCRFDI